MINAIGLKKSYGAGESRTEVIKGIEIKFLTEILSPFSARRVRENLRYSMYYPVLNVLTTAQFSMATRI